MASPSSSSFFLLLLLPTILGMAGVYSQAPPVPICVRPCPSEVNLHLYLHQFVAVPTKIKTKTNLWKGRNQFVDCLMPVRWEQATYYFPAAVSLPLHLRLAKVQSHKSRDTARGSRGGGLIFIEED